MKNINKYIIFPAIIIIVVLFALGQSNSLKLSWGGNRAYWVYILDSNYMYPSHSINMKAGDSLKYNGVTVTSGTGGGGGDVYLSNRQTFTARNIFSDTLKADGLSLIDNARITSNLNVTGDVISDLQFIKGSRPAIGTADNYGIVFKTADTNRMSIDSLGDVTIEKNLDILGGITATNDIVTLGDITGNNINGQVSAGSITSGTLDTARIPNTAKIDTSKFARLDTLTTERVSSKWTFFNTVLCVAAVTFSSSPVFSALVDFANGISTTTITTSGLTTFNGDVLYNGWSEQGGSLNRNRYFRDTVLQKVTGSTGTTLSIAHGIDSVKRVVFYSAVFYDDSSGNVVYCPATSTLYGSGMILGSPWLDRTNINLRIASTAVNMDDNTDTVKFYIRYTDYQR